MAVAAPAVFFLFAVQRGAMTVPWWDHCELHHDICDYFAGHFDWKALFRPHNHSRPLTYRVLYLVNAIVTRWDGRSEYIVHVGVILAGFALQAYALWRLAGKKSDGWFLGWLAVLSAFCFSPVGHHNQWYSMHLQLTLAHLLVVAAVLAISIEPGTWRGNLLAAVACWLATYTLSGGLVAMICLRWPLSIAIRVRGASIAGRSFGSSTWP